MSSSDVSSEEPGKLRIPDYDEVPLALVADGVTGLRTLFVNVFGITSGPGGWVLVDTALPFSANRIASWANKQFGRPPSAIIQTHGHFDHTGALVELADRWNVPVYAHPEEAPYLTGKLKYPPPDPTVDSGLFTIMSPLLPRGPVDVGRHLRLLGGNGELADLPGWKWIHTPGHTAGHISLFRAQDRTLIVGDAFCTTDQSSFMAIAQQRPELHGPPPYFTPDWDGAKASVEKLAALRPRVLAPGHGQPLAGADVEHRLQKLARDFDRIARPEKYRTAR